MSRSAPTPARSVRPPLTRCSAASSATSVASDAVCWMTPPPRPSERNRAGSSSSVGQPVEHVRLELGRGGRGGPEHALHAQPGREQVAEDRRPAGVGREVREERRVLPVGDARQQHPVEVAQHAPRTARPARAGAAGSAARISPGLTVREHREGLEPLVVVGDPVDRLRARTSGTRPASCDRSRRPVCQGRSVLPVVSQTHREETEAALAARSGSTGAPGGIRTHTGRCLRPLPLPVGIQGLSASATRWHRSRAGVQTSIRPRRGGGPEQRSCLSGHFRDRSSPGALGPAR